MENDAGGLLQNLITASVIDCLPLAQRWVGVGGKHLDSEPSRSSKIFLLYSEHLYVTQKCFNQDFIFCKYSCLHIWSIHFSDFSLNCTLILFSGKSGLPCYLPQALRLVWFTYVTVHHCLYSRCCLAASKECMLLLLRRCEHWKNTAVSKWS